MPESSWVAFVWQTQLDFKLRITWDQLGVII